MLQNQVACLLVLSGLLPGSGRSAGTADSVAG